jgi:hypothetical protein
MKLDLNTPKCIKIISILTDSAADGRELAVSIADMTQYHECSGKVVPVL